VTPEKRARNILAAVSEADAALRRAVAKGLDDREIQRALSNLGDAQMLLAAAQRVEERTPAQVVSPCCRAYCRWCVRFRCIRTAALRTSGIRRTRKTRRLAVACQPPVSAWAALGARRCLGGRRRDLPSIVQRAV